MKPSEIKRLLALQAKAATELNEAEKAELTNLQAKAAALKDDDSGDMTAEDVKKTVEAAVKAALPAGNNLTEAQVKTIVADAVKGIQPGPDMITSHPDLFWGLVASMWIGNCFLVILNVPLVRYWLSVFKIPFNV